MAEREAIYLTTVGEVEDLMVASAEMALWHTFGYEIRRLPGQPAPPGAFDAARQQWNSSLLLREVARIVPDDALRLLALTEMDLFIPMLSFVFGQAQFDGRVAIVSSARLRQTFYRLVADETLLVSRLVKEVVHEMGHTFGLVHCENAGCPMSLSTSIRQVDVKGSELCPGCFSDLGTRMAGTSRD